MFHLSTYMHIALYWKNIYIYIHVHICRLLWFGMGIKVSCTTTLFISLKVHVVKFDPVSYKQRQTISHYIMRYRDNRFYSSQLISLKWKFLSTPPKKIPQIPRIHQFLPVFHPPNCWVTTIQIIRNIWYCCDQKGEGLQDLNILCTYFYSNTSNMSNASWLTWLEVIGRYWLWWLKSSIPWVVQTLLFEKAFIYNNSICSASISLLP